jgi:hypothetical protein
VKTAAAWKRFYEAERARLGEAGLSVRLERAPDLASSSFLAGGALVFPHTKLEDSGHLVAAVAKAVLRTGAEAVLAIGVLHGAREEDADLVSKARAGDARAIAALRRVHGDGAPGDDGRASEEFSIDGFVAMLTLASRRAGRKPPRVVARYPFLVGDDPGSLPGLDELARLAEEMPIVATTDPIHHGAGYGTPEGERRDLGDEATVAWARTCIEGQLDRLVRGDWQAFAELAASVRSDFRDDGPVLASLLRARSEHVRAELHALELVDYADALGAPPPTWVAAPLVSLRPAT